MNLYTLGTTIFNYAAKGGMIAAGAGMLFISLTTAVAQLPQPTTERLLVVLGNYFIIGALIGAIIGLVIVLRQHRR